MSPSFLQTPFNPILNASQDIRHVTLYVAVIKSEETQTPGSSDTFDHWQTSLHGSHRQDIPLTPFKGGIELGQPWNSPFKARIAFLP
jgi:hypothetical protein